MKITELLSKDSILLGAAPQNKEEAIDTLVDLMEKGGKLNNREGYKQGVLEREASGTTGIGEGIAIPHAKVAAVKYPGLSSMTVPDGVDYESLDGEPSKLFFMIAAPAEGGDVHIEVLQRLSMLLMSESFRNDLLNAKDIDTYLDIIDKAEREKFAEEYEKFTDGEEPSSAVKAMFGIRAQWYSEKAGKNKSLYVPLQPINEDWQFIAVPFRCLAPCLTVRQLLRKYSARPFEKWQSFPDCHLFPIRLRFYIYFFSVSTLSVFSHGKSKSLRPK